MVHLTKLNDVFAVNKDKFKGPRCLHGRESILCPADKPSPASKRVRANVVLRRLMTSEFKGALFCGGPLLCASPSCALLLSASPSLICCRLELLSLPLRSCRRLRLLSLPLEPCRRLRSLSFPLELWGRLRSRVRPLLLLWRRLRASPSLLSVMACAPERSSALF